MKHSYHLDSLRGFLSLVVVMQHTAATFVYSLDGTESILNTYLGLAAHYAVLFFFVLSGYVITISITENIKRNDKFNPYEYSVARIIRILPPLIGAILFSIALSYALKFVNADQTAGDFKYFIRQVYAPDIYAQLKSILSLTISGNLVGGVNNVNGALWSLVYEIQFYVFAGLISMLTITKKLVLKCACIFLIIIYYYQLNIKFTLNIQIVAYLCFTAGSISYLVRDRILKIKIAPYLTLLALIFAIGIQTQGNNIIHQLRSHVDQNGWWMLYKVFMGLFFSCILIYTYKFGYIFSLFNKISSFSYSLYITHFPLLVFLWFLISSVAPDTLRHKYLLSIASVIFCCMFAKVFSFFFEKPKQHRELVNKLLKTKK
jgi:peptidoglycan/LPS O-acetylase OafA/YrhL